MKIYPLRWSHTGPKMSDGISPKPTYCYWAWARETLKKEQKRPKKEAGHHYKY